MAAENKLVSLSHDIFPFVLDSGIPIGLAPDRRNAGNVLSPPVLMHEKTTDANDLTVDLHLDTKLPTSVSIDSPSRAAISRATQRENGEKNGEVKCPKQVYLTSKVLRQILVAKETLFKFGTFVPRNETEALRSPESHRWVAGRDLEWLRMGQRGTFERDWTLDRMLWEFPAYKKSDMGFILFYVFDYKT